MKNEMTLEEIKKYIAEIAAFIDKVCTTYGLRYYLWGGTLLGAIRHDGFIPWDDDVDIGMPYPDYLKFISIMDEMKNSQERYIMLSEYKNDDYYYPFAKVVDTTTELYENPILPRIKDYGVYVDIFPIYGLPNDQAKIDKFFKLYGAYEKNRRFSICIKCPSSQTWYGTILKFVKWKYTCAYGWKHWLNKMKNLTIQYSFDESQMVVGPNYGVAGQFTKACFDGYTLHKFEQYEFRIPCGYDEFLSKIYGDYMQLPPESQRVSNHNYKAYIK